MKVLFLNEHDAGGGAARAATRLLAGVRKSGLDASMMVTRRTGDFPYVIGPQSRPAKAFGILCPELESLAVSMVHSGAEWNFSPAIIPERLAALVATHKPDVVHLHWVTNAMMRIETLPKLNVPVIWTLHDSWVFTGGCHVPSDCTRYRDDCGKCPVLGSTCGNDLSGKVLMRKGQAWRGADITLVAPSRWLAESARSSSLFRNARVETIANGLDTSCYKPVDKRVAREALSLPQDRKLVLFGAVRGNADHNKGFHLLLPAIQNLAALGWGEKAELVVFGSHEQDTVHNFGMKAHYMGWFHDDVALALLYSAADLFVFPSIQEALGYTAMESMACGTPCVAFRQGGVPDLIDHRVSGYLAEPFDSDDLAAGMLWLLEHDEPELVSREARTKIVSGFAIETVARQYCDLYDDVLRSGRTQM